MGWTRDLLGLLVEDLAGDAEVASLLGHSVDDRRVRWGFQPSRADRGKHWLVVRVISDLTEGPGVLDLIVQVSAFSGEGLVVDEVGDRVREKWEGDDLNPLGLDVASRGSVRVTSLRHSQGFGSTHDEEIGFHRRDERFRLVGRVA